MAAISRGVAAEFDERRGEYDRAAEQLEQALAFMTDIGVGGYRVLLLARLAIVHLCAGNLDRADELLTESMRLADELAFAPVRALSLNGIANVRRRQGRLEEAEGAATRALNLYRGSFRSASAPRPIATLATRCLRARPRRWRCSASSPRLGMTRPGARRAPPGTRTSADHGRRAKHCTRARGACGHGCARRRGRTRGATARRRGRAARRRAGGAGSQRAIRHRSGRCSGARPS